MASHLTGCLLPFAEGTSHNGGHHSSLLGTALLLQLTLWCSLILPYPTDYWLAPDCSLIDHLVISGDGSFRFFKDFYRSWKTLYKQRKNSGLGLSTLPLLSYHTAILHCTGGWHACVWPDPSLSWYFFIQNLVHSLPTRRQAYRGCKTWVTVSGKSTVSPHTTACPSTIGNTWALVRNAHSWPNPVLRNQKLWRWGPAIHVLRSPPGILMNV